MEKELEEKAKAAAAGGEKELDCDDGGTLSNSMETLLPNAWNVMNMTVLKHRIMFDPFF